MYIASSGKASHSERIAFWFLHLLFLANVYRAATQSFTCDEAFTFTRFVGITPFPIFRWYDANNHILHTILCRLSTQAFGVSEFSMRIPALLGGLAYFVAIYRLSLFLFGPGLRFLLAIALLAGNPYVLEFLSVARGYGLALAFFAWAFYLGLRAVESSSLSPRALTGSAYCLALSVASNLTFVVPAAALGAVTVACVWSRSAALQSWRVRLDEIISGYAGPGFVTGFLILVLPLSQANASNFYVGADTVERMLSSLITPSLYYHDALRIFRNFSGSYWTFLENAALPATALFLLAVTAAFFRMLGWKRSISLPFAFSAGTLLLTVALTFAMHFAVHVLYPEGRTGIYFLFLIPLAGIGLADWLAQQGTWGRISNGLLTACLALVAAAQLLQYDGRYYFEWRFDANTKEIARFIEAREAGSGRKIRIGGSWIFEPALNFYRIKEHYDWMEQVQRQDRPATGTDYYILDEPDEHYLAELHLRKLKRWEVSHAILAVPE